jgi:hypothetical protein
MSTQRNPALAALAFAAASIASLWWFVREPREPAQLVAAPPAVHALPSLQTESLEPVDVRRAEPVAIVPSSSLADAAQHSLRVTLKGVLRENGAAAAGVSLLVTPEEHASGAISARTDSKGRFALDVSTFFKRDTGEMPDELLVKASRSGAAAQRLRVSTKAGTWERVLREHREIEVDLELRFKSEWTGVARVADGSRTDVRVAAFALDDEGLPRKQTVSNVRCDPESGAFRIDVPHESASVVVAYAPGYQPRTARTARRRGGDLGVLVLDRGATISGRATLGGEPIEAHLSAARAGETSLTRTCYVGSHWLTWTGEGFEWTSLSTMTDLEGRFRLDGFDSAHYTLSVGSVRGGWSGQLPAITVRPPALDLELGASMARVELEIYNAGSRAAHEEINVRESCTGSQVRHGSLRADAHGFAVFWVNPDHSTVLSFPGPRGSSRSAVIRSQRPTKQFEPTQVAVENPVAGQTTKQRVDL